MAEHHLTYKSCSAIAVIRKKRACNNLLNIFCNASTLANYVVWNVIQDEIPNLSKKFRDIRNKYKNKVMGSHGQRKRWKICVSMTNDYLGDVIGEAYSRIHFDKERKALVGKTNL